MGYGCGDSFSFDFEPNLKENCHHKHIPFDLEGNGNIVLSVRENVLEPHTSRDNRGPLYCVAAI